MKEAMALVLGPHSADILLSAAAFYLRYGDCPKGVDCASQILTVAPAFWETVYSYLSNDGVTAREVLGSRLLTYRDASPIYLRYFMGQSDVSSAARLWSFLEGRQIFDKQVAVDYIKFLSSQRQYSLAVAAWRDSFGSAEFLLKGGFELSINSTVPFEWAITPV